MFFLELFTLDLPPSVFFGNADSPLRLSWRMGEC
jgi:hypothetical protein